ncbi:regulating synaptic membrane exocytosis protein fife [Lycorma delicatula]|uniref:regulating synaptic membrane exocytosis protein fife n=1 Tax=Lycorma delicatula TaxID=130591 RepID=UPI003F50EBC5
MLPTNVMSFMKKMVTTNESGPPGTDPSADSGTLSKLRQTLSSSLMTAQDKVTKLTPSGRTSEPMPSTPPDSTPTKPEETAPTTPPKSQPKVDSGKPPCRSGACRVCLKSFKPDDYSRTCFECQQKVCEDCASYSKLDVNEDENTWRCSICRRKMQSRAQPVMPQDSTDSLLDVPVLEALTRRHSDAKIGSSGAPSGPSGLAPPRSPELRRHSDVSPASLKELEKSVLRVAGERREEMRWERELEWRHKRGSAGAAVNAGPSVAPSSGGSSPSVERRMFPSENWHKQEDGELLEGGDDDWRRHGGGMQTPNVTGSTRGTSRQTVRRKSRVQKQHSYDDEIKGSGTTSAGPNLGPQTGDVGLGLPVQLPRRASAYDVYATRGNDPASSISALTMNVAAPRSEGSPAVGRRSSFRVPPPTDSEEQPGGTPLSPETAAVCPSLIVDEDRRTRRRGSQLPDINAIRARGEGSRASINVPIPRPAEDHLTDSVRRQQSVTDGEAIKIVIHDVDYDPNLRSKRRVTLKKDPTDKAHRTRGFGMRVVGGKAGADGRLFAYVVWTVPGGPAEKGGLQQGDKVLEWCGVSLVDRSFEEVCAIMDHTGDTAELLVEQGTDLRMCDLLDEPMPGASRKNSGEALGLQLESEGDKSPASPTRRKLPKTPEQLAREKAVSGRIQLQVWYHDEKNELVVSVLAADDLAPREDTGFGTLPEAYVQFRLLPFTEDQNAVKTEVAEPSQNPIWNTTVELGNISGEQLMEKNVEVTLWDFRPDKEQVFLGECSVDLQKALLDDRPVWYRLEDPHQLRSGGSTRTSPRTSLANELTQRLLLKGNRSFSEEKESDLELDTCGFLHPDHAYTAGSRRGSSQSEQLEVETYQLNKDFSRSLPGSRRSSFQSPQNAEKADVPPPTYNKERRRSSVCQRMRDPDEIYRSLKAVAKGEMGLLGRSHTFRDKQGSRRGKDTKGRGRKGSVAVVEKIEASFTCSSPSDEEEKWSSKDLKPMGPGQIKPRGYQQTGNLKLKLSLLMTKGQLEVEVICARGIEGEPPDTYVKTYLRDGERWLQKRKTRPVRHSLEPQFHQTLRYSACDVLGRSLVIMLWEKQSGFEHNVGLGGAEVALDAIKLTTLTVGWYPLFPIQTLGSDSNDSP